MTRFVVGSFLLALVELIGFAAYTTTHRVGAGVVAVRPDRGGSGSSRLTALLDPEMGRAVRPLLPAAAGCMTLALDIRYVNPITVAIGTIVASGTVLHHGRRTATAEGRIGAADTGARLAHSPSTLLVLS